MITILGFWISNGEKHPHERVVKVMDKTALEQLRIEIAKEFKINKSDVLFKYQEQ